MTNDKKRNPGHRIPWISNIGLLLLIAVAAPRQGMAQSVDRPQVTVSAMQDQILDTCAKGSINGFVTVSIAATVALFAEVALPSYPILYAIGLGVGCSARIIGTDLESYGKTLWQGSGTTVNLHSERVIYRIL